MDQYKKAKIYRAGIDFLDSRLDTSVLDLGKRVQILDINIEPLYKHLTDLKLLENVPYEVYLEIVAMSFQKAVMEVQMRAHFGGL